MLSWQTNQLARARDFIRNMPVVWLPISALWIFSMTLAITFECTEIQCMYQKYKEWGKMCQNFMLKQCKHIQTLKCKSHNAVNSQSVGYIQKHVNYFA